MNKRWALAGAVATIVSIGAGTVADAAPKENQTVETFVCGTETVSFTVAGRNGWVNGDKYQGGAVHVRGWLSSVLSRCGAGTRIWPTPTRSPARKRSLEAPPRSPPSRPELRGARSRREAGNLVTQHWLKRCIDTPAAPVSFDLSLRRARDG